MVEAVEVEEKATAYPVKPAVAETSNLFAAITDERLMALGVLAEELPKVRQLRDQDALDKSQDTFDATSLDILFALAAGYADEEIRTIVGIKGPDEEAAEEKTAPTFADIIVSDESRQHIFIPKPRTSRRVFEGDLEGWRIFLHRDQRRVAYRDYNGPAPCAAAPAPARPL